MLLQDLRSESYTKNYVMRDNEEVTDPRVTAVVYNREPRSITVLQTF